MKSFASDNYASVHPKVFEAMLQVNEGHARSYGEDPVTSALTALTHKLFGPHATMYPVLNGTSANVISLSAVTPRWGSVVATDIAHINTDEGGAPEKLAGLKIVPVTSTEGKLNSENLTESLAQRDFVHAAQPTTVSITQATELGTLYSLDELAGLCDFAHQKGLIVHMDGARISNAAATLNVSLYDLTTETGIDILSLGGTKNGAMNAEAVVVLNPEVIASRNHGPSPVEYIRKHMMSLSSKMRYISAQLLALFSEDLYLSNARQANAMAQRLANGVQELECVEIIYPVETNSVFASIPSEVADQVRAYFPFYDWVGENAVRWMCSFDTTENDVDSFLEQLRTACLSQGS